MYRVQANGHVSHAHNRSVWGRIAIRRVRKPIRKGFGINEMRRDIFTTIILPSLSLLEWINPSQGRKPSLATTTKARLAFEVPRVAVPEVTE